MTKTVLLADDELGFIEPLEDALLAEGYNVIKASSGTEVLDILESKRIDLVSIDVMMSPGKALEKATSSHETGLYLAREILARYPDMDVFCLSVVNDENLIRRIESTGVRFLRKGETPLRTVLDMMRSRLTGIAYSTHRDVHRR